MLNFINYICFFCFKWLEKEFDTDFYNSQVSCNFKDRRACFRHYLSKGWKLGIDPCPWFSSSMYLSERPFLLVLSVNPFLYFCTIGMIRREFCNPSKHYVASSEITSKPVSKFIRGQIDSTENGFLIGWVLDLRNPISPVELSIFIDGKLIFDCLADCDRPDLKKLGFVNNKVGFEIAIPNHITSHQCCEICIDKKTVWKKFYFTKESRLSWNDTIDSFIRNKSNLLDQKVSIFNLSPEGLAVNQNDLSKFLLQREKVNCIKVSVIMPVRNRSFSIENALNSVLNQTYDCWEIIVIDDASTDSLHEILESYIEKNSIIKNRIKVIRLSEHCGVSHARNLGLSNSTGEIIAYLDSDNSWESEYLKSVVSFYSFDSNVINLYCAQNIYYKSESCSSYAFVGVRIKAFNLSQLISCNFIDLNCYTHRHSVYKELGGFDPLMTRLVDWDFIIKITKLYPPKIIPYALSNYFIDSSRASISNTESYMENYNYLQKKLTNLSTKRLVSLNE